MKNNVSETLQRITSKYYPKPNSGDSEKLSMQVYHSVVNNILSGKLAPGTRITERKIAEQFGTSNMPVREAMFRLEMNNWVIRVSPRVVVVSEFNSEIIKKIYEMRDTYETSAIRMIAGKLNQSQLDDLGEVVEVIEYASDHYDKELYDESDRLFHRLIVHFTKNDMLERAYVPILEQAQRFNLIGAFRSAIVGKKKVEKLQASTHKRIYEALLNHDQKLAEDILRHHLRKTYEITTMISKTYELIEYE